MQSTRKACFLFQFSTVNFPFGEYQIKSNDKKKKLIFGVVIGSYLCFRNFFQKNNSFLK